MSEQQLRRKIAAAKSYLSRLDNQRREVLRSTREHKIDLFNRLTAKRDEQYLKFRELCNQLHRSNNNVPGWPTKPASAGVYLHCQSRRRRSLRRMTQMIPTTTERAAEQELERNIELLIRHAVDEQNCLSVASYSELVNRLAKMMTRITAENEELREAARAALMELEDSHVNDNLHRLGMLGKQNIGSARHQLRAALGESK